MLSLVQKEHASSSSIYGAFVSISCKNQFAVSSGPAALWICLFVFSKIFELGDTVLLILRKRPLSILHVWHHPRIAGHGTSLVMKVLPQQLLQ